MSGLARFIEELSSRLQAAGEGDSTVAGHHQTFCRVLMLLPPTSFPPPPARPRGGVGVDNVVCVVTSLICPRCSKSGGRSEDQRLRTGREGGPLREAAHCPRRPSKHRGSPPRSRPR